MNISDSLRTLYSATVEQQDGHYQVTVPARQIDTGTLEPGETYRIAILSDPDTETTQPATSAGSVADDRDAANSSQAPVNVGETRDVEITDLGDQGDGIAKIEQGFVVIVPDTDVGDRVTVEMDSVRDSVAFAHVVD